MIARHAPRGCPAARARPGRGGRGGRRGGLEQAGEQPAAAALERIVAAVRRQGFATTANEGDTGLAAVSVPVFDAMGDRLRLALTVFGRVGRLNTAPDGPVAALMMEAARSLAAELHG